MSENEPNKKITTRGIINLVILFVVMGGAIFLGLWGGVDPATFEVLLYLIGIPLFLVIALVAGLRKKPKQ